MAQKKCEMGNGLVKFEYFWAWKGPPRLFPKKFRNFRILPKLAKTLMVCKTLKGFQTCCFHRTCTALCRTSPRSVGG
jgi:hypothetical protein